jgi:hypothetical protein
MLQELSHGLDGIGGVDGCTPGDDVDVDEALKSKNAMFRPTAVGLRL